MTSDTTACSRVALGQTKKCRSNKKYHSTTFGTSQVVLDEVEFLDRRARLVNGHAEPEAHVVAAPAIVVYPVRPAGRVVEQGEDLAVVLEVSCAMRDGPAQPRTQ